MSRARVAIALLVIVASLVVQTTVFGANGIEPFGVAPAIGPYVEPEYHLLLGFTAGILADLMGSGTLGLWAMALTVVAYASSRLRARFNEGIVLSGVLIFSLTLLGQVVFVLLGTLFGQDLVSDSSLVAKIVLPAVWNLVLGIPVLLMLARVFKQRERGWAT